MNADVWTCVRCKCTSETGPTGDWFMQDRDSDDGLCQDCIEAVLAEWLTKHSKMSAPEHFIPRSLPGEFELDDDDE